MYFHRVIVAIGLCLLAYGVTWADGTVTERQTAVKLYRGASIIAASDPKSNVYVANFTPAACDLLLEKRWKAEGLTRTAGEATYKCQVENRAVVSFHPAPVQTCGTKPADEQRQQTCPAGTVGTWLQDRVWALNPYPTCWVQGQWTPISPPSGMCAPVTPPASGATTAYINAGGPAVSNYVADVHYVGGATSSNCQRTYTGIYLNRRYAPDSFSYQIPVANGSYLVKLLTRECWNEATGQRIQRATIEGVAVPQYDTFTTANGGVISTERTVTVADGVLNITMTAVTGDAMLNGIDVVPAGSGGPEPDPDPPATGTATLRWTPSTKNSDGSSLTNLAGYRIHYGASADELVHSVQVANPGASSYVIDGLSPGIYYFGLRAYTSGGTESAALSNVVSKTVP